MSTQVPMQKDDLKTVLDFVNENWALFNQHCQDKDISSDGLWERLDDAVNR